MKCPKCDREISEERKTCMYCGEPLDSKPSTDESDIVSDDTTTFVEKDEVEETKVEAFPDTVELNVKDISHNEQIEVTTHEESKITEMPLDDGDLVENQANMTLDRALSLLTGMKDSFNSGHINAADYDKLIFEIIKDYILPMDDKEKINFVANGIMDSELSEYLDEEIHKNLRSFVIAYVANK